jgi:sugar O-acyltransferase (sialic acid O-acetyltransferase NeuD family)
MSEAHSIVIWGASGHARVVAETVRRLGSMRIAGFIDDMAPTRRGEQFCGATVLGGRECLPALRAQGVRHLAIAFGHNEARLRLGDEMKSEGFVLPTIVHPNAVVADDAEVGEGSFVGPLAAVNSGARVGRLAIVNTGAIVEHDCVVGDGVHLSPRACLAGDVEIGMCCWIGAGATVREKIAVGMKAVVGMGAVVVKPVPEFSVVYGCPAVQHGTTRTT